jgi:hypothetical protein
MNSESKSNITNNTEKFQLNLDRVESYEPKIIERKYFFSPSKGGNSVHFGN